MKRTFAIVTVLAIVLVAVVQLRHHHRTEPARASVAAPRQPTAVPSKNIVFKSPKMAVVVNPGEKPVRRARPVAFNPKGNVWSDIGLIVNDNADYRKRLEAIGRLPAKLTDADWGLLRDFLLKPDELDSDQLGQVLKNEIMDRLCLMDPMPGGLGDVLGQIYRNLRQNEVVRDYALQHVATMDEVLAQSGGKSIGREEQADQKVLWSAINESGDSIAGTALLGLERLSEEPKAKVDQSKVADTALKLANDSVAGELTRITAYEVCAQMDVQDALPVIEAAAQNSQTVSLQISAIGALGLMGGANEIPVLQNLAHGGNERLQLPVQAAIQRIEQRAQAPAKSI
ncbi:MAG TPA: hypothetical protein VH280_15850 [Verrucomicrobiae bacterium]|jgi:hypothetical protein|nr:hypothetical protein [Verrucomicrobiae bacterium]